MKTSSFLVFASLAAMLNIAPLQQAQAQRPLPPGEVYVSDHEGHRFVAESPERYAQSLDAIGDLMNDDELPGLVHVELPHTSAPSTYSLAGYQTSIKNQLDRGTCWAFAGAAALEAAYVHEYGVQLNLSEQYINHVGKAFELYPTYLTGNALHENNCSIDGAQGSADVVLHMSLAAIPQAQYAPYLNQEQMQAIASSLNVGNLDAPNVTQQQYDTFEFSEQNIPRAARWNAKYRVSQWAWLPNTSSSTIESVISGGHEVVADINLQWKWNAAKNAYDYDPTNPGAGHCVLLIGYDRNKQIFIAKNSWGGTSYLNLTYNFIQHCMGDGTYITQVTNPNGANQAQAAWIGKWNYDDDGYKGTLVIRRFIDLRNPNASATKLGNLYMNGNSYDVNGYFSYGGRGMVFYVAGTTAKVAPGTLTGQYYQTYFFSWDPSNAAGYTLWNNLPYGVNLSRDAMPGTYASSFNINRWLGTWNLNFDGWHGKLTLTKIGTLFGSTYATGTFQPTDGYNGGKACNVSGVFASNHPGCLKLNMLFTPSFSQEFDLYCHSWETNVLSGITYNGGVPYGVQGFKP